jgi:hypothetical protein
VRMPSLRRRLPALLIVLLAALALGVLSASSSSNVTRARLERSLPQTFANLYLQQAEILGHKGMTAQSLQAQTQCDKGGPNVDDQGPGADWICLMTWHDPYLDPTLLPGKFEVNVHSNDCYTAGGPSKILGLLTITDAHGNDVPNPVFEFDGCFNPNSSNRPTGVTVEPKPKTAPTTAPAALTLPYGSLAPDGQGRISTMLICSAGDGGCAGTATATLDGHDLGTRTYAVAPGMSANVQFRLDQRQRRSGGTLQLAVKPIIGTALVASTALTVKGS